MRPDVQPHRKVYARGYYDGLRSAGVTTTKSIGEHMNQARMQSIMNSLSGVTRKVFEMVPIAEEWTSKQIHSEAARAGHRIDIRVLEGCLSSLVDSKLISEPSRGHFKKDSMKKEKVAMVQPKSPLQVEIEPTPVPAAPVAQVTPETLPSPIAIMGQLSSRLGGIIATLTQFANDFDTAAITIEDQLAESEGKHEKLKQLQQLLKSLG